MILYSYPLIPMVPVPNVGKTVILPSQNLLQLTWDEDVDDEEWDDDEGQDGEGEDNDDKDGPIDPRWTPLLNLN